MLPDVFAHTRKMGRLGTSRVQRKKFGARDKEGFGMRRRKRHGFFASVSGGER